MRRGRGKKGLIFSWAFYLSNHHALKWIIFEAYNRAFIMCDLEFSSSVTGCGNFKVISYSKNIKA